MFLKLIIGVCLQVLKGVKIDKERNLSIMTHEETMLSQKGDQYLRELAVVEFANEENEDLSNFKKYDEELGMLEYWLINPRIDKDDCLMHACM